MWVSEASLTKLSYKIFHVFSYIQELPGGKKENKKLSSSLGTNSA